MSEITAHISATASGLEREFSIIAHNLANVSTVGYKRRCSTFAKQLMAKDVGGNGTGGETQLSTAYDFSQGNLIETGRSLDFALCGRGFFVVETPDGPLYTRNGMFRLNQNGQVVDSAGRIVAGENGPITISLNGPSSQVTVSGDGTINVGGVVAGKFRLVDFNENVKELSAAGFNCFQAPKDIKPKPAANLIVKQGFQEGSNVQLADELVDMMMVSRLYEANMKFVSAAKDVSQSLLSVALGRG
jgi:flagellar basal body rod protein FlgG